MNVPVVACVWVKGNVPYGVEYVTRLRAMVERHLPTDQAFRFVCLTDRPSELPDNVEGIEIPPVGTMFGWWAKVNLFRAGLFTDCRVLYLDLDTLIVKSLEPVINFPSSFALVPDAGSFQPKTHHHVIKRFNSSVMVWDAGINRHLFDAWTPKVARTLWGDQDWIGLEWASAATMPAEWFPRLSSIQGGPVPSDAIVVLAKKPKPEEAARRWPWVAETWRAA